MSFLNVPKPTYSFPLKGSPQLAGSSSSSNKKVALKKGYGLHDWIVLTKSGKDLTGIPRRRVTESELREHNCQDNAWTAIHGKVYNIAPYMAYHPGGVEELMRAAGRDGTDLFNEVHMWVNVASMMEACLIGPLVSDGPSRKSAARKKTDDKPDPSIPRFDWYQSEDSVHFVLIRQRDFCLDDIVVAVDPSGHQTEIVANLMPSTSFVLRINLHGAVLPDEGVRVKVKKGNAQISMNKANHRQWSTFGELIPGDDIIQNREVRFHTCKVLSVDSVTHNTKLFHIRLPPGTFFQVPVGRHVAIKQNVHGMDMTNPYTAVRALFDDQLSAPVLAGSELLLMIKVYPNGLLTPHLGLLKAEDTVLISDPQGTFDMERVNKASELVLIAMGTGFTPMTAVISHALAVGKAKLRLLFANRTEEDILWCAELDKCVKWAEGRLEISHVLSQPGADWDGFKGRITLDLLRSFLSPYSTASLEPGQLFIGVCGSTKFNVMIKNWLQELAFNSSQYHIFAS